MKKILYYVLWLSPIGYMWRNDILNTPKWVFSLQLGKQVRTFLVGANGKSID